MTATNDFQQFAYSGGANVLSQAAYIALAGTILDNGYPSGILPSQLLNKTLRQSATMAALIGDLIVAQTGQNATDDGTTTTLLANLITAINASVSGTVAPGTVFSFGGATPPAGALACPTALTYVSATTYFELAFSIGSEWGGGLSVNAGSFIVGHTYVIETVGSTDFTLIGAASNTVGLTFTATGVGVGTGAAWSTIGLPFFPTGYVPVQGTIAALTHGALLAHNHTVDGYVPNGSSTYQYQAGAGEIAGIPTTSTTGGSDNLAAGYGVQYCVQYI